VEVKRTLSIDGEGADVEGLRAGRLEGDVARGARAQVQDSAVARQLAESGSAQRVLIAVHHRLQGGSVA